MTARRDTAFGMLAFSHANFLRMRRALYMIATGEAVGHEDNQLSLGMRTVAREGLGGEWATFERNQREKQKGPAT